jgi:general secretion pathway protein I
MKRGFTLLEVMVALALMGLALVVLIKSAASNILAAEEAHMMGIATDLARGKMYDIEERLLKEGFTTTDQSECDKDFSDEGFESIKWCSKVEVPEMPDLSKVTEMAAGKGSGAGSGSGSYSDSNGLAGMIAMMGGGKGGQDILGAQTGGFVQAMYPMIQKMLNDSIRKVTLTVTYKVLGHEREIVVVSYYTDPAQIDQTLQGFGAMSLPTGGGSGSGTVPP